MNAINRLVDIKRRGRMYVDHNVLFLRDASRLGGIDDPGNTMLRRTRSRFGKNVAVLNSCCV